ncbi:hypothetical protein V8E36_002232 [Tilletia maclaganii]
MLASYGATSLPVPQSQSSRWACLPAGWYARRCGVCEETHTCPPLEFALVGTAAAEAEDNNNNKTSSTPPHAAGRRNLPSPCCKCSSASSSNASSASPSSSRAPANLERGDNLWPRQPSFMPAEMLVAPKKKKCSHRGALAPLLLALSGCVRTERSSGICTIRCFAIFVQHGTLEVAIISVETREQANFPIVAKVVLASKPA